ncbi:MAG: YidC/Oxa1 family insertase periplasmic-domain containing protein [Fibrobacter sp.]|nr:YidC/Oxa1 family insertase periplasmic-domain containing protein [Fibrobacter sp.]
MNKNTIIGSILIAIIVIWWMAVNNANAEAQAAARAAKAKATAEKQAAADSAKASNSLVLPQKTPEIKAAPVLGGGLDEGRGSTGSPTLTKDESGSAGSPTLANDSSAEVKVPAEIAERTVTVETDKFIMTLTNKGGKVKSVIVKALPDSAGKFPELIQDTTLGAFDLKLDNADLSDAMFELGNAPEKIVVSDSAKVQFAFQDANGNQVIRSYGFTKDGPAVRQENRFIGFQPSAYELAWKGGLKETEDIPKSKGFMGIGGGSTYYFSEVVFNNVYSVEREMPREQVSFNATEGKVIWAGLRRKYVAMTVQFDEAVPAALKTKPMKVDSDVDPGTYKLTIADDVRGAQSINYDLMILPLKWDDLASLNKDYEKIIVSGWSWCGADVWFVWICKMLLKLLNLFYSIIPNYGVAIILVTIIVRGITTPFTVKQIKSTRGMAALKPQLDEINVKYRSDPQKKQAAMMELYSKNNINPLASCTGGCLPMLIQMPIFMGLFFVLGRAIELRGAPAFLWITDLSRSDIVWDGISIPIIMPSGLAILPWLMVASTYFQTKVTMSSNAGMDPAQQKMMMWMMPAMMLLFSAVMPSGLVLYWIIGNIWSIVQYKYIYSKFPPINNGKTSSKLKGKNVKDAEIVK